VDAFLEDLKRWEQDPESFERDPARSNRINTRFHEMIGAFVSGHGQTAPVYVTQEIAPNAGNKRDELTASLASSFQFVPQGLVFKLATGRAFEQPPDLSIVTRGLADGSIKFEENDVVRLKVLPVYVSMLANRGIYLAANRRYGEAIESFENALELDPGYAPARQALNAAQANLRQEKGAAP
jgi:tetratricopeptide (TPR) repeat protein